MGQNYGTFSRSGSGNYTLYGQEAVNSIWAMAKINLFFHGEDNHHLEWGDVIRDPKLIDEDGGLKLFDPVAAHPPPGLAKWGYETAENDPFGRFRRGVPPKTKGDYEMRRRKSIWRRCEESEKC